MAAGNAKLSTAFAKVAFSGDFGITWHLVHSLGEARAKELLLLSDVMTAQQPLDLGLLNRLLPAAELMSVTLQLAARRARWWPFVT